MMKEIIKKTAYAGMVLTLAGIIGGCSRPTKEESVYRVDLNNEYSWEGKGPDIFMLWPWYDTKKVSHTREVIQFPVEQNNVDKKTGLEKTLSEDERLSLETEQSIYTALENGINSLMLQDMVINYALKADTESVRKYMIDHREKDRNLLSKNIDGLIRTYLQTLTKSYIETHQDTIGEDVKKYLKSFKAGGTPIFDENHKYIGVKGGYTLEEEWGIDIINVSPRRIRAPSYVLNAIPEGEGIVKRAQGNLNSAQEIADLRRSKLRTLKNTVEKVGDNPQVISYLKNQSITEMTQAIGSRNIGTIDIYFGMEGGISTYGATK